MSTWQATVRAPSECVVLMSGEDQAVPIEDRDTRKSFIYISSSCKAPDHKFATKGFCLMQHIYIYLMMHFLL